MPLQNRVDPWGTLLAVNARGAWLGNRGILHNAQKEIIAPWRHKAWITCTLVHQGIRRPIFQPHSYSELFFLDEATAFSAGHRPCAECRRARYTEFKGAWCAANRENEVRSIRATAIDNQLHTERAARGSIKVTYSTAFQHIPVGTLIEWQGDAWLYWQGQLNRWSPAGYVEAVDPPPLRDLVTVLTPRSIVRIFAEGFVPQVHESASS